MGEQLRSFADVEPLDQEDVWGEKIPRGLVTLLIGDSGIGKDFLLCDLGARVTRGDVMPDGTPGVPAGHVIMINPEDDPQTVTVHRLKAARADLAMVHDLTTVDGDLWQCNPDGLAGLRAEIALCGGARLVTISALGAVAPCALTQEVTVRQKIMNPLQAIARDTGAAIVIVVHLTKDGAAKAAKDRAAAKDGAGGSKGLTSAARQILLVTRDKNDPRIRTIDVVKSNNDRDDSSPVRYTLVGSKDDHSSRVQYLATVDVAPDSKASEAGQDALLGMLLLADRPSDAQSLAAACGIDWGTARILLRRLVAQGGLVVEAPKGMFRVAVEPQYPAVRSPWPGDDGGRAAGAAGLA